LPDGAFSVQLFAYEIVFQRPICRTWAAAARSSKEILQPEADKSYYKNKDAVLIQEQHLWRCHPDSDRGMKVLQTLLPPS